ncbi:hypothetical protein TWF730_004940 [Orbilia blumenaviensis]|uniref:Cation efflux protein transmembrane domain-containing protein n=1 Tax=Orbilia blumenaviensis TaxID=1796055 RepID=A0AAV9VGR1_9PEZI
MLYAQNACRLSVSPSSSSSSSLLYSLSHLAASASSSSSIYRALRRVGAARPLRYHGYHSHNCNHHHRRTEIFPQHWRHVSFTTSYTTNSFSTSSSTLSSSSSSSSTITTATTAALRSRTGKQLLYTKLKRPTTTTTTTVVAEAQPAHIGIAKMASKHSHNHNHDHDHDHDHDHEHEHEHDHGHSHSHGLFSHHHHHNPADNIFLTSKNKADAGVRITRIGLFVNVLMAISKGFGGWYFHSQALIADAMHALTDLVSDFMTLATVSWALKPPTKMFPNGFGKVESLGSLGVSSLLLFGGLAMGLNSVEILYTQLTGDTLPTFLQGLGHSHSHIGMDHGHGHDHHLHHGHDHGHDHSHSHSSHSHVEIGPNIHAAWLAGGSILVKEWLYRATMKIAKERKSSVLASNAVHHRIDSLTAMVALVSISLSNILHGASWLDPVGGLLVSLMVIRAGWSNTRAALFELADMGIEDDMCYEIKKVAANTLKEERLAGVKEGVAGTIKSVGGIKSGQNFLVDITVSLEGVATLEDMARIEGMLRSRVGEEVRGVRKVRVKFIAEGEEEVSEFVENREEEDLGSDSEHEHEHEHENGHHGHEHGEKKKEK